MAIRIFKRPIVVQLLSTQLCGDARILLWADGYGRRKERVLKAVLQRAKRLALLHHRIETGLPGDNVLESARGRPGRPVAQRAASADGIGASTA